MASGGPAAAFAAVSSDPAAPSFLSPAFASALRDALLADTAMGELARAAQTAAGALVSFAGLPVSGAAPDPPSACFIWRHDLLYSRSASGDRLCIPAADGLRGRVLEELHATPLGALARRLVWWPRLAADVTAFFASCPTCQRTKAEHGPPAGLLFPLPVPSRRGGTVSLDFLELPKARSGHNFMQVHVNLLTCRVWLVQTFKSATSEVVACNFVTSVFHDVGLPNTMCQIGTADSKWSFGHPCTAHWAPPSFLGRQSTTTPQARSSGSTVSLQTSCVPLSMTGRTTGWSSPRWWSSPSTMQLPPSARVSPHSLRTAASTLVARSPP